MSSIQRAIFALKSAISMNDALGHRDHNKTANAQEISSVGGAYGSDDGYREWFAITSLFGVSASARELRGAAEIHRQS